MSKTYDFSHAKRGAVLPSAGKSRITIYLDDLVIERFKALSEQTGKGYQTLINEALRAHLGIDGAPLTAEVVRQIIREELAQNG
ncbi:MAG: BrnA antitoxin family protein [Chromatiaceae bacterium]